MKENLQELRQHILQKAKEFQKLKMSQQPISNKVPVSGKVVDEEDIAALVDASLDGWLTTGRFAMQFEMELGKLFGLKYSMLVNSGSSANLVAISALTSGYLGEKRLKKGDEVITAAVSFPTTVNPIFQNHLVPVFVDAEMDTYNADVSKVEEAITKKTRAIIVAHTLGNPFDVRAVLKLCKEHNLFLIEDCCDALGAKVGGKMVGTFGDFATLSFYPAHHITMGEGGAVLTNDATLARAAESFRDWGRDCWCKPGCDNTCGKRFQWKLGSLPYGYDHKYIYSNIGYNLKATDMQAAIGVTQLKKLPSFIKARQENFEFFLGFFKKYEKYFILPRAYEGCVPSPFGYVVNIREGAPFSRNELVEYLEKNGIGTRMLFGGNIVRQPAYEGEEYRVCGSLKNADHLMNNSFWIGVYPGITKGMREQAAKKIEEFLGKFKNS